MNDVTLLFTLLFTKHFIVDFPLQKPFQYLNKGTYGHFGGILHASLHGLFTALCFWYWAPLSCLFLGLIDAVVHYHVDWAKMNLNKKMGWGPQTHEEFWWLLGADQLAHALTYIWLVSLVTQ
jgi:hypothetical protein